MTRAVTLLGYLVLVAWAVRLELDARRRGVGTFGDAVALLLHRRLVQALLVAVWLWWGWHIFVRVD